MRSRDRFYRLLLLIFLLTFIAQSGSMQDSQECQALAPDNLQEALLEETKLWCIQLELEDEIDVWIVAESPYFDIRTALYNSSKELIDADDDGYEGTNNSILVARLIPGEIYYLEVGSDAFDATDIYAIALYTEAPGIAIAEDNCAVNIAGQGWHASGGTGGLYLATQGPPGVADIPVHLPATFDSALYDSSSQVALIIMDDFTGTNLSELDVNDPNVDSISHGQMISYHFRKIIEAYTAATGIYSETFSDRIMIEGLHIGSYEEIDKARTDVIAAVLRRKVQSLLDRGIGYIVVNASFSILPCSTLSSLEDVLFIGGQQEIALHEDYELQIIRDFTTVHDAVKNTHASVTKDALGKLIGYYYNGDLNQFPKPDRIVFVASAGNLGPDLSFYLYPGAWNEFISVTALDKSGSLARYASRGEVSMTGGWYQYSDTDFYYTGTSFAAPIISFIAALYMSQETLSCPFAGSPPPMARRSELKLAIEDVLDFDSIVLECPQP